MSTVPHPLRRASPVIAICFLAMTGAVIGAPFVGTTSISFAKVFSGAIAAPENLDRQIFLLARLPRAVAAALVGGCLAAAGVVFQGLLRNPLARLVDLLVIKQGDRIAHQKGWKLSRQAPRKPPPKAKKDSKDKKAPRRRATVPSSEQQPTLFDL